MTALETLAVFLRARLDEAGHLAQSGLLADLPRHPVAQVRGSGSGLPVLAHLADAVAVARLALARDVGDALAVAAAGAVWTQTAAYVAQPPGPGFLDGYAHATLRGPVDGAADRRGGAPRPPTAAWGMLLLGPDVDYPHHHHPADEVYLPLTTARWSHGRGTPLVEEPARSLVHHRPWQAHAMTTGAGPLLALYLWTGDVTTPSAWC